MASKTVLVTVGTTRFDPLIDKVTTPSHLQALKRKGYSHLNVQYGNGSVQKTETRHGIEIMTYRFKDSLAEDISTADLVISHAGAGSCLEVLEASKPLIVVINDKLMDNHQAELANALQSRGHAFACTPETLLQIIQQSDPSKLIPYPKADPEIFVKFLDGVMGLRT